MLSWIGLSTIGSQADIIKLPLSFWRSPYALLLDEEYTVISIFKVEMFVVTAGNSGASQSALQEVQAIERDMFDQLGTDGSKIIAWFVVNESYQLGLAIEQYGRPCSFWMIIYKDLFSFVQNVQAIIVYV